MTTATELPTRSPLSDRINDAIASVGVVGKDKTNPHFRYEYLSEEAVKRIAAKACKEFGIAPKTIRFTVTDQAMVPRKNGDEHRVTMCCVLGWEDGSEVEGYGCGMDPGDKAIMKAQTAAIREAWKNRLCIATGADPEGDEGTDQRGAEQPQQREHAPAPQSSPRPANGNGAAASKPQANTNTASAPAWEFVPFGRSKGKHISEIDDRDIAYLVEASQRSLNDPGKARFHDMEQRRLDALQLEQDARRAMAAGARRTNDDAQPPAHTDDDIPF